MDAANERYLAYMAAIDNPDAGLKDIDKMSSPAGIRAAHSVDSTCSRTRTTDSFSPSGVAMVNQRFPCCRSAGLYTRPITQSIFLSPQTITNPWADQESGAPLQVLPDKVRSSRPRRVPQNS